MKRNQKIEVAQRQRIRDFMDKYPKVSQTDLGKLLGVTSSRICEIVNNYPGKS